LAFEAGSKTCGVSQLWAAAAIELHLLRTDFTGTGMRLIVLSLLVVGLALSVGCSDGTVAPPSKAPVGGTVTLDGKPMPAGEVRFNQVGQPAVTLPVKDGAFSGEAFVGDNRVDVVWEKEGPPHPMDPNQKLMVNAVDGKFSGPTSPFQQTIAADGAPNLTFAVTSARR